jgi:hypothetical protein
MRPAKRKLSTLRRERVIYSDDCGNVVSAQRLAHRDENVPLEGGTQRRSPSGPGRDPRRAQVWILYHDDQEKSSSSTSYLSDRSGHQCQCQSRWRNCFDTTPDPWEQRGLSDRRSRVDTALRGIQVLPDLHRQLSPPLHTDPREVLSMARAVYSEDLRPDVRGGRREMKMESKMTRWVMIRPAFLDLSMIMRATTRTAHRINGDN